MRPRDQQRARRVERAFSSALHPRPIRTQNVRFFTVREHAGLQCGASPRLGRFTRRATTLSAMMATEIGPKAVQHDAHSDMRCCAARRGGERTTVSQSSAPTSEPHELQHHERRRHARHRPKRHPEPKPAARACVVAARQGRGGGEQCRGEARSVSSARADLAERLRAEVGRLVM